jgi:prevent-host-death family protein
MDQAISMVEAKSKLADLVGQVAYAGKRFILERRGRPMAVLISVDEYRRLQELEPTARGQPLPPELGRRQAQLIAQAHRLRARLGDPVDGLAELLSTLPPEGQEFWFQLVEETP